MVAQGRGLDLKYVTNGTTTTGDADKDFGAVMVSAGSDIQGPEDLAGRTVAVNNLNNIGDTTIRSSSSATAGPGREIALAQSGGAVAAMYAFVVTTGLLGVLINMAMRVLECRALARHSSVRGEVAV